MTTHLIDDGASNFRKLDNISYKYKLNFYHTMWEVNDSRAVSLIFICVHFFYLSVIRA